MAEFQDEAPPRLVIEGYRTYEKDGMHKVMVKVVDIFGNDTNKLVEVKI